MQRALVGLERQDMIASLFDDLCGNGALAVQRVDSGTVHIRFQPELGRFLGRWGLDQAVPGNVFDGYRRGPPAVS
jgi:hypothetical protein